MAQRSTHTVRITSSDNLFFADVEVLDAFSLTLPNGAEILYHIVGGTPTIIDNTGDGNGKSGGLSTTRLSHMTRLGGATGFDVEMLDAFTIVGPNGTPHLINCPASNAVSAITDPTGSGLTTPASFGATTRAQHVILLTPPTGQPPTSPRPWQTPGSSQSQFYALELIVDTLVCDGPNLTGMPADNQFYFGGPADVPQDDPSVPQWGEEFVLQFTGADLVQDGALIPNSSVCNDTTNYTIDPVTGLNTVPPPNTDPNVYVFFPAGSNGPFLFNSQNSAQIDIPSQVINTGPLWWIRQLGGGAEILTISAVPTENPLPLPWGSFVGALSLGASADGSFWYLDNDIFDPNTPSPYAPNMIFGQDLSSANDVTLDPTFFAQTTGVPPPQTGTPPTTPPIFDDNAGAWVIGGSWQGETGATYSLLNVSGVVANTGGPAPAGNDTVITLSQEIAFGPPDGSKFGFGIQISLWNPNTVFAEDPDGYLIAENKSAPLAQYTESFGETDGPSYTFTITLDVTHNSLSVSGAESG